MLSLTLEVLFYCLCFNLISGAIFFFLLLYFILYHGSFDAKYYSTTFYRVVQYCLFMSIPVDLVNFVTAKGMHFHEMQECVLKVMFQL